ncbi:hypothetical protein NHF48_002265 [Sphingomonas sp. H160509]|uniref:hypothetical protein n=1 Tax=Sphingomonas sp. H160509 TaxID=2955313 RepID=UPI002096B55D|nr:hypothetical protein [Sphingomonas sp. H160509]MDD1450041.1 hypothetical protein [Sphingomonas sp. H160509]
MPVDPLPALVMLPRNQWTLLPLNEEQIGVGIFSRGGALYLQRWSIHDFPNEFFGIKDLENAGIFEVYMRAVEKLIRGAPSVPRDAAIQSSELDHGGQASRPEGYTLFLTTQSDQPPQGVFKSELKEYRGIRDGTVNAPTKLPVLYEFPPEMIAAEEHIDPTNFYITKPATDLLKSLDDLEKVTIPAVNAAVAQADARITAAAVEAAAAVAEANAQIAAANGRVTAAQATLDQAVTDLNAEISRAQGKDEQLSQRIDALIVEGSSRFCGVSGNP